MLTILLSAVHNTAHLPTTEFARIATKKKKIIKSFICHSIVQQNHQKVGSLIVYTTLAAAGATAITSIFPQKQSGGGGGGAGFRVFQGNAQDLQRLISDNIILIASPTNAQLNTNRFLSSSSTTTRPNSNSFNNRAQYPANTLFVLSANGELIQVNGVQGSINVPPTPPRAASFSSVNTRYQQPTTEAWPFPSGAFYQTIATRPVGLGTTDFEQYRRQVLLGEAKHNESYQPESTDAEVNTTAPDEDFDAKGERFQFQENSQNNKNQITDSVEEFQRAVEELRKRYAKLNKDKSSSGQQVAILL
ncbi:uncharacterized protein [Eurosta solidaginis]|uniref:uncharacterized protein n=1 Tax=Eurosta solidaginis TaxID=178769 RepID=UPI0035309FA7